MECAGPGCEKVGDKACSKCLSRSYCGPVCQRADWDGGHKAQCKKLAAERAAAEAAKEATRAANLKGGGGNGGGGPPQSFDGLSVKQLKELLRERGISTSGMTERSELVAALAQMPSSGGGGGGSGVIDGSRGSQVPPSEAQPPPIARIPTGMDSRVTCWDCASCGKALDPKAALMCMGCRKVVYCDRACSRKHVREHWDPCFEAVKQRVYAGDVHKGDAADEDGTAGEVVLKAYIIRARGNYGDKDVRTLEGILVYGAFLYRSGRLGEAEPLMREALAVSRATLGPKHPNTLTCMNNLAQCCVLRASWARQSH